MKKIVLSIAWIMLILGGIISIYFVFSSYFNGLRIWGYDIDYEITGQFGDFIGGVVGTFFALSGTLLIYLTFKEQQNENRRISFESSFFEMIKLYRENVSELKYRKYKNSDYVIYENREVLREIFDEFIECYREVRKFSNSKKVEDYLSAKYAKRLETITRKVNPNIDIIELARIDIAYSIIFFGLNVEGESIIRKNFQKKYNTDYYCKLLFYIKLKPHKRESERYVKWEEIRNLKLKDLRIFIDELYKNRNHIENADKTILPVTIEFPLDYEKYYDGHQFRLGHYFRHLYQSYKFLNMSNHLKDKEKYSYGKMLRAQLSTYEQALVMINSVSSLGMKWEYLPEKYENPKIKTNIITTYQLIKNLPGVQIYGLKYKVFYPLIKYEFEEQIGIENIKNN